MFKIDSMPLYVPIITIRIELDNRFTTKQVFTV